MMFFNILWGLSNIIPGDARRARWRAKYLHDFRKKYNALRNAVGRDLKFRHVKMIKGGWNIGFIVDNKYVFKIRKKTDAIQNTDRIMREKRITDAFADIVSLAIPNIEIVNADDYTFYRYNFMPGRNMNTFSPHQIRKNAAIWGAQIGEFIYQMHNTRPAAIDDLRATDDGDGWNHNDICNNVIINPKTMRVVGIIDWEYAGWGKLDTEFENTVRFSKKIRNSGILNHITGKYSDLMAKAA